MSRPVHFLHIRKTGGTAIRNALADVPWFVVCHHDVGLADLPAGGPVAFAVRDPVERAVSGFYDRMRRGAPAYTCPWAGNDAAVFKLYRSMEAVAADLGSQNPPTRLRARWALSTLTHTSSRYWHWFKNLATLRARAQDVLYGLFTPSLEEDFARLTARLGVGAHRLEVGDEVAAHRAPPEHRERLSAEAVVILRGFYASDYDCLRALADTLDPAQLSPSLLRYVEAGMTTYWEG